MKAFFYEFSWKIGLVGSIITILIFFVDKQYLHIYNSISGTTTEANSSPVTNSVKNNQTIVTPELENKNTEQAVVISQDGNNENKKNSNMTDYSACLNSSLINSENYKEIGVLIIDDNNSISSISNRIASKYNYDPSLKGKTGLFKSCMIESYFKDLYEGNSQILEKLNLNKFVDYVALGKVSETTSFEENKYICHVVLSIMLINTKTKEILQINEGSEIKGNGNGATKSQAMGNAVDNLISNFPITI